MATTKVWKRSAAAAAAASVLLSIAATAPATETAPDPDPSTDLPPPMMDNVPQPPAQPHEQGRPDSPPPPPPTPQASYPDDIVIDDGVTEPVFGYEDAVRQRVWVDSDIDSDGDGVLDTVVLDIIRPAASDDGLDVPVIMDASPYYTTICRGNEGECKADLDGDGLLDRWPLFYDNYFVPRGYAVVLLDVIGTGSNTTGCPDTGGYGDAVSAEVGIDWLNGRRDGRDADGNPVVADWHNGKSAMIGKSYDGTLANAAAASGVEGLSTIVPISAISSWYRYSRSNGIRFNNNYQGSLSNWVTNPERRAHCADFRDALNAGADDATADYNDYWAERDYERGLDNVTASVFVVHGINDWNVKTDHFNAWWTGLSERDVPRKLWLTGTGHVDPFDFRRDEWVDTVHRWFDHWLHDVDNGIMDEPMVDLERAPDVWETHDDWPLTSARPTRLHLGLGTADDGGPGSLGLLPFDSSGALTFTDTPQQSQNVAISDPENPGANRLVFLTPELQAPLHLSGSPLVTLRARVDDVDTNFAAVLVDYGTRERFSTQGDGIRTLPTEDCWGKTATWGGEVQDGCYFQTEKTIATQPQEMVTKGIIDGLNLTSLTDATPLIPGDPNVVDLPLLPEDYVFEEGHRIGVVVLGSFSGYRSIPDQNRAQITVRLSRSTIDLPLVGGIQAARRAGL